MSALTPHIPIMSRFNSHQMTHQRQRSESILGKVEDHCWDTEIFVCCAECGARCTRAYLSLCDIEGQAKGCEEPHKERWFPSLEDLF